MSATHPTLTQRSYQPADIVPGGRFVALEGVGGSGKSTLAALLAARLGCTRLHTAPDPINILQAYVNAQARPLPHLTFYLAGALHVSDLARRSLASGHVIADRYISSVIANHSVVHHIDARDTQRLIAPFLPYLVRPDLTVYLHTDPREVAERNLRRHAELDGERKPLADLALIARLQSGFDRVAAEDPTAAHLETSGHEPEQLADAILRMIPGRRDDPPDPRPEADGRH